MAEGTRVTFTDMFRDVLLHELGHAVAGRELGYPTDFIELGDDGYGKTTFMYLPDPVTDSHRYSVIVWAGVLADPRCDRREYRDSWPDLALALTADDQEERRGSPSAPTCDIGCIASALMQYANNPDDFRQRVLAACDDAETIVRNRWAEIAQLAAKIIDLRNSTSDERIRVELTDVRLADATALLPAGGASHEDAARVGREVG